MRRLTLRTFAAAILVTALLSPCCISTGPQEALRVPLSAAEPVDHETIRVAFVALKNFGDAKAENNNALQFIAARVAEQALHGVCAVDEVQDIDGSALEILHRAVEAHAGVDIALAAGGRVGEGSKEQFAFFWNPDLLTPLAPVETVPSEMIERDPALASFRAAAGFDFTLCVFHTPPYSGDRQDDLKRELSFLDDLYAQIQAQDGTENDVLFLGDFNAPARDQASTGQKVSISDGMGSFFETLEFVVLDSPTNVLQTKSYDNIFFDPQETTEFRRGSGQIVRLDLMQAFYSGPVEGEWPRFLQRSLMDHCPVYAEFSAKQDTD